MSGFFLQAFPEVMYKVCINTGVSVDLPKRTQPSPCFPVIVSGHEWTQDSLCQWVCVLALSLGFCDTAQPCRLCLSWRSRVCWCPAALCSLWDFGEIVHALLCLSFLLKNGQECLRQDWKDSTRRRLSAGWTTPDSRAWSQYQPAVFVGATLIFPVLFGWFWFLLACGWFTVLFPSVFNNLH